MIAVVKYNAGNIRSVLNALERQGVNAVLTDDPDVISQADKVIFPGVGEAGSAMAYLKDKKLDIVLKQLNQPFLGICLGLQLMCTHTEEGNTDCLGIFPVEVKKFNIGLKVPHMGWNNHTWVKGELFEGISAEDDFYFVHSYYAEPGDYTIGMCEYGVPFSAALKKDNYYAVQFHPEKSARTGEKLLQNFLKL